jgi:hypothetical protein
VRPGISTLGKIGEQSGGGRARIIEAGKDMVPGATNNPQTALQNETSNRNPVREDNDPESQIDRSSLRRRRIGLDFLTSRIASYTK